MLKNFSGVVFLLFNPGYVCSESTNPLSFSLLFFFEPLIEVRMLLRSKERLLSAYLEQYTIRKNWLRQQGFSTSSSSSLPTPSSPDTTHHHSYLKRVKRFTSTKKITKGWVGLENDTKKKKSSVRLQVLLTPVERVFHKRMEVSRMLTKSQRKLVSVQSNREQIK